MNINHLYLAIILLAFGIAGEMDYQTEKTLVENKTEQHKPAYVWADQNDALEDLVNELIAQQGE